MLNPPLIWLTINPCDLHDLIAQLFAGENTKMEDLLSNAGPSKEQRAKNIATDPYTAAKFFHFLIRTIIHTLFGVEATTYQVKSRPGIFGQVAAYFGIVKSQNRGSLHLHMLLWLKNTPPSYEIESLLQTEGFRDKVRKFICVNFRVHLPGFENEKSIKNIPSEDDIAWSCPPDPTSSSYNELAADLERRVVRSKQMHKCDMQQCLMTDKKGNYRCKRQAPFPLSEGDVMNSDGHWFPKRLYAYVNGWIPTITINLQCNNDGKLLTSGQDTKNIAYYVTNYAAKKQGKTYNLSVILAKGYAYHTQ